MVISVGDKAWIEVICGCVFSGKTEELIRRVKQMELAHRQVQAFRADPTRHKPLPQITSHSGLSLPATPVTCAAEIEGAVAPNTEMIAVDEVQFLESDIVPLAEHLADRGVRVILAGLDMNFQGEPFGSMPVLLAKAEIIEKRYAICVACGRFATRSQRLIGGIAAARNSTVIVRGGPVIYEPRCKDCHEVPENDSAIAAWR